MWDDQPDGATPLDPDQRDGLKFPNITTMGELNELEQENILEAQRWFRRQRKFPTDKLLTRGFVSELHRRMFGQVWKWAGTQRRREIGFGADPLYIPELLENLLGDAATWVKHGTYSVEEFAARLHHRLVYIHPFPNGNGRHAREFTDIVITKLLGSSPISWTGSRTDYIEALRAADGNRGDYAPLSKWIRAHH